MVSGWARFDPSTQGGALVALFLTLAAGAYWWVVLVPGEKAILAHEKRQGQLGAYLEVRVGPRIEMPRGPVECGPIVCPLLQGLDASTIQQCPH